MAAPQLVSFLVRQRLNSLNPTTSMLFIILYQYVRLIYSTVYQTRGPLEWPQFKGYGIHQPAHAY